MAEKKEIQTDKGGNKKKMFLIIGIIVLVLLAGAGTAAFFLLKKSPDTKEQQNPASQVSVPELNQMAQIGPMVNIEEFIINIISADTPHYVKATFAIELTNEEVKTEVELRMPQMRDAILLLIGNKSFEELQDLQGKNQLKAEITSKINSFLKSGKVKAVYFTNFVVQ
ncbi:MAG: flagellar basal body protein FliL [Desulfobulbaceae bacterium BRH_c16a]|nr:MAG: flagellar basal body protein FliL [Desulfobulbaceae bacterium BRH_c16a]